MNEQKISTMGLTLEIFERTNVVDGFQRRRFEIYYSFPDGWNDTMDFEITRGIITLVAESPSQIWTKELEQH